MSKLLMHLFIRPLSYIHIGSGNIADPFTVLIKDNRALYLNFNAYIRYLMEKDKNNLDALLRNNNLKELMIFFFKQFDTANSSLFYLQYPVSKEISDFYKKDIYGGKSLCQINQFSRNAFLDPFIAGSALKGALRTAILDAVYNSRQGTYDRDTEFKLLGCIDNYNKVSIPSDPFKYLKISDASFPHTHIELKPIIPQNVLEPVSSTSNIDCLYEVLKPNQQNLCKAKCLITSDFFVNRGISSILNSQDKDLDKLIKLIAQINKYYQSKLKEDIESLKNTQFKTIYAEIQEEFEHLTGPYECIIRLGKGAGRFFNSFSKSRVTLPKTRSLIDGKSVGWCKITFGK